MIAYMMGLDAALRLTARHAAWRKRPMICNFNASPFHMPIIRHEIPYWISLSVERWKNNKKKTQNILVTLVEEAALRIEHCSSKVQTNFSFDFLQKTLRNKYMFLPSHLAWMCACYRSPITRTVHPIAERTGAHSPIPLLFGAFEKCLLLIWHRCTAAGHIYRVHRRFRHRCAAVCGHSRSASATSKQWKCRPIASHAFGGYAFIFFSRSRREFQPPKIAGILCLPSQPLSLPLIRRWCNL